MRTTRYPVPSHSQPARQNVSRVYGGLTPSAGAQTYYGVSQLELTLTVGTAGFAIKTGVSQTGLTLGIDTAGFARKTGISAVDLVFGADTSGSAFEYIEVPKIARAVPAFSNAPLANESRFFPGLFRETFSSTADLGLVFGADTAGYALKRGVADLGLIFGADTSGFALKRGVVDLGLVIGISAEGTSSTPASAFHLGVITPAGTNQGFFARPIGRETRPLEDSAAFFELSAAEVQTYYGAAALGLTLDIGTAGFALKRGVSLLDLTFGATTEGTVAGQAVKPRVYRAPLTTGYPLVEASRYTSFLTNTPPIYRVIVQGGTNEGFVFKAGPQALVAQRNIVSRVFGGLPTALVVYGAVDLPLTIGLTTAGFSKKLGAAELALYFDTSTSARIKSFGAASLPLIIDFVTRSRSAWTLNVVEDDDTLSLVLRAEDGSQSLTLSEADTLTLTLLEEQSE